MVGEEKKIHSKGMHIVYQAVDAPGANHAVVLLHGVASNATRFHEWMTHSHLRGKFKLLAMDQRGHGRSMTYRRFTRQDWCDDISAMLQQEQATAVLVGHSLGAQTALEYARNNPQGVDGLILIDPVFPQALTGMLGAVARLRWLLYVFTATLRFFNRIGIRRRHYLYRDLHQLDIETRAYLAANAHKGIASLYMDPFADLKYMPLVNYLQDLYEVTRPLGDLRQVRVPVLVLLSQGASTSNVERNRVVLADIPACEIRGIDADHWLLTERPEQAREAIDTWCSALPLRR